MSQLTKKAIVEATLALAQSKPIAKITVRDIVEACGITRNTFYYHFHDIYEVLEDVIDEKFDALEGTWGTDPANAVHELRDFFNSHRRILSNLYRAIGHDALEGYLYRRLYDILMEVLRAENVHYAAPEEAVAAIADFYAQGFSARILRKLKADDADIFSDMEQFGKIFEGIFGYCLGNCGENHEELPPKM